MKFLKYFSFIIFLFVSSFLIGQQLPPINIYTPKDYEAENQNWSISQSEEKFIYVANNKGLLEFNGARWKLYPTPNETIMRSVKVIDNKIFTGFYMDFGFWTRNNSGELEYTSIPQKSNISLLEDEQFWNIIELDNWLISQSLQRIYLYNLKTEEYKIIDSPVKITKMFEVNETIYFHQRGKGVYKIEKGLAELVSDDPVFKNNNVINIHKKDNDLLFLTDNEGFFLFDGKIVTAWSEASSEILNKTIYNSIQLSNGGFVLGTISDGVVFLSSKGKFEYKIQQENGLSNNTVLSVFEDLDNNIWFGLDSGINSVNTKSNITIYKNENGSLGTVYSSIVHNEILYLGTNQGLFFKRYNSEGEFAFVQNTQGQVWSLTEIEGQLFCGHDSGAFIIDNGKIISQLSNQGTWHVKSLNKNKLLLGNYLGLEVLEKKKGQWVFRNKVEGFNNSSRFFEIYNRNQIFVNHEYKGVFKLTVDEDFQKVTNVIKDSSISKGLHSSLLKYQNEIIYAYRKGVYKYSDSKKLFVRDSILSSLYTDSTYVSGKLIYDQKNNILFGFSEKNISYISQGKLSENLIIHKIPLSKNLRKGATGFENIYRLSNNKNLLGINNGYILFDIENQIKPIVSNIYINSIKTSSTNSPLKNTLLNKYGEFSNTENNIEFNYSIPFYDKTVNVEYQYKLEGLNTKWSNWSTSSSVLFDNLNFGDFIFKVRARIGNTLSDNTATYEFSIARPWYLSNIMITVYVLAFIIFTVFIHGANRKYYKTQSKKLLEKQQREFKVQKLEKEKQVMFLKNEQLRADVESKNRELATSTMSIIKKNEFLNSIKNELKKVGGDYNVNKVIKIIDKDLNNTNDWEMFKEAFNNADKDFIKKVKSLHPDLTPNDLRLCAYLRLNLSSKEIAPLLNISPRSVEVKRYRLRKKMDLKHNANLTNYILEV